MKKSILISILFIMSFAVMAQSPGEVPVQPLNWGVILGALLALSEILALIPAVKANSIFQLLFGWLKSQKK